MKPRLSTLIVEDSRDDTELLVSHLEKGGYDVSYVRVETCEEMQSALREQEWDVVLSDHKLPHFDDRRARELLTEMEKDIPFIVVSGAIGEEAAVAAMRAGAHDYIMKNNMRRLLPALDRELREAKIRKEKREIEAELPRLYREAQQAIRMRDEFISIASHELKTPITSLRLSIQLLRRQFAKSGLADQLQEKTRRSLELAEKQTGRLTELVNHLLDVSRIGMGQEALHYEEFDLVELAHGVIELACENQPQECNIRLEASTRAVGRWDRFRLIRALTHLLTNAIKYGRERPIALLIETRGDSVILTVRDQGIGIAREDQERIFDKYERAVSSDHFGGLGMGLYLVRAIIRAHGGDIRVESDLGAGASFIVQLPLRPPSESTPASVS